MKAQRYQYSDLKRDVVDSNTETFSYEDLKSMLTAEPFYLNETMTKAIICYIFEKEDMKDENLHISSQTFLRKTRKLIGEFDLLPEEEEEEILSKISQLVSVYPKQLETAFENWKNG